MARLDRAGVLAAAAALVGWRAGGTTPRNVLAFGAFIVGTILFVLFVVFTIAEAKAATAATTLVGLVAAGVIGRSAT